MLNRLTSHIRFGHVRGFLRWSLALIALLVLIGSSGHLRTASIRSIPDATSETARVRIREALGKLPRSFEANEGQTDAEVKFLSRGNGYNVYFTATEVVFALQRPHPHGTRTNVPSGEHVRTDEDAETESSGAVMRMKLVGANPPRDVRGLDRLPTRTNYFKGSGRREWHTKVTTFATVEYVAVYPGIDVRYHGNQEELEYDFVVHPGADSEAIRINFEGVDEVRLDSVGDLVTRLGELEIRHRKPVVYQEVDGSRHEIAGGYVLAGRREVGFNVAHYDQSRPLIIDPVLIYSTYVGSSGGEAADGIALDRWGNIYLVGETSSVDFPKVNPIQDTICNIERPDAFVTKINSTASAIIYSTYLGGCNSEVGRGIAVDGSGNAFVTGVTNSSDFPTMNPVQATLSGDWDVFVAKLDSTGSTLAYSTYLGGTRFEQTGGGIAVDELGHAYLAGFTDSPDFPTANALQPGLSGPQDAFVVKLNTIGSAFEYATFLGGTRTEAVWAVAIDQVGNAYITGHTSSLDLATSGVVQPTFGGGEGDAFIAKINSPGSALVYATYLGGTSTITVGGGEYGGSIAVDDSGNAHVTGTTDSIDFPTVNAFQPAFAGDIRDAFVAKINADGTALLYSTYLGGDGNDYGDGIAVDSNSNAYITGFTQSTNFPTANPLQETLRGVSAAFVTKLTADGSLEYSTYLGGTLRTTTGMGITVDDMGAAYVTGVTTSSDFPTTTNALRRIFGPPTEVFVAKIGESSCADDVSDQVDIFRFPFQWIPFTGFRFQWVIIHNKGAVPIGGPLAFVIDDLQNAAFIGSRFATRCFSPEGDPFILVGTGSDNVLSPNESTLAGLWFFKTHLGPITYTPHVLSGMPTR